MVVVLKVWHIDYYDKTNSVMWKREIVFVTWGCIWLQQCCSNGDSYGGCVAQQQ